LIDFSNDDERERWCEAHSQDVDIVLAVRAALRVVPALGSELWGRRTRSARLNTALRVFRCMSTSWAWATYPDQRHELWVAAHEASPSPRKTAHPSERAAIFAARAVAGTGPWVSFPSGAPSTSWKHFAHFAIGEALDAASSDYMEDFGATLKAITADAEMLEQEPSPVTLAAQQLWPKAVPRWVVDQWRALKEDLLRNGEDNWQVWSTWYEDRLIGATGNQALELARATLPDEMWKPKPKVVNAHIKLLEKHEQPSQQQDKTPATRDDQPPDPRDQAAFERWLSTKPRSWLIVIAVRAALRALPLKRVDKNLLGVLRGLANLRFAAMYQTGQPIYVAGEDANTSFTKVGSGIDAAIKAATAAARSPSPDRVAAAVAATIRAGEDERDVRAAVLGDAQALHEGSTTPGHLAAHKLWILDRQLGEEGEIAPTWAIEAWRQIAGNLMGVAGAHWSVWTDWYDHLIMGSPWSEAWEAAFTSVEAWRDDPEEVNAEIARRLDEIATIAAPQPITEAPPDLHPVEGVIGPITIVERPDGRIGVDPGSLPVFPPSMSPDDHARVLSACRSRGDQLRRTAGMPTFNGRSDYAEALAAYVEWLPDGAGEGNIVLADGEARLLNKLFTADQDILATGFASKLSVLLEDHIGLRAYYPEIERHYLTVKTGRLTVPLERDAVERIQQAIRENTPTVFEESVDVVMGEAGKQVPEVRPPLPEDAPAFDPNRPRPPRDPIGEIDPQQSRNWVFASAINRIWGLVLKGKEVHESVEGWQQTYHQMRPYVGPILQFLRVFWSSGGDGTPPMPPTIVT
jgi:hypothetical protein